jgi:hypothetical protein
MVSVNDVAVEAVRQLALAVNSGFRKLLLASRDLSFDDAARTIAGVLGRRVRRVRLDPDAARAMLRSWGVSEEVAGKTLKMYRAVESGRLEPENTPVGESNTNRLSPFLRTDIDPGNPTHARCAACEAELVFWP